MGGQEDLVANGGECRCAIGMRSDASLPLPVTGSVISITYD